MPRGGLISFLALALWSAFALQAIAGEHDDLHAATVIEINGDAAYEGKPGDFKPLDLGQFVVEGDELRCGADGEIHLLFPDGSSLVCGPNTEIRLNRISAKGDGSEGCRLREGTLELIRDRPGLQGNFEILSDYGLLSLKNADAEFDCVDEESTARLSKGEATLSDPLRKRLVLLQTQEEASASPGRVNASLAMPKRDYFELQARDERNRKIHAQSGELMKYFVVHLHERRAALEARRSELQARLSAQQEGDERSDLEARTKAARERFKAAQDAMGN